jgi:RNA polymerase sigma-70 factor, ECF subfamily
VVPEPDAGSSRRAASRRRRAPAGSRLDKDRIDELVVAARGGDRFAFDQLVEATYLDTYTLAHRLTGNDDDARDVVQETYLRAFRSLDRFRGDAQFTTWLYRITANCASTYLGRRGRHRHDPLPDDLAVAAEHPRFDPEGRAEVAALRGRLQVALQSLPPKLRAVVVLRDVYDLPHEAIADELGISATAAKVRLHRARRRLRDILYAEDGPVVDDGGDDRRGDQGPDGRVAGDEAGLTRGHIRAV